MSHLKERREKNCLNCNAVINGKFCSICGQENLEPQESVWHLITHFFNDITHFDGKFFSSVKYVFLKPGFLTSEYVLGRRMSYLNPVRFYVFTSFLFFLIFFNFIIDAKHLNIYNDKPAQRKQNGISVNRKSGNFSIDTVQKNIKSPKKSEANFLGLGKYRDKKEYDSLKLLGQIKENGLAKLIIEKGYQVSEKYDNDKKKIIDAFIENILHAIPQTLFFTLPIFAFALQLLYMRSKKHYYVGHAIFTLHLYIFIYLDLLLCYFFTFLAQFPYLHWLNVPVIVLQVGIYYYAYRAMRNFYGQGRWKTLLKFLILIFALAFISIIFAIIAFTLSIYKM